MRLLAALFAFLAIGDALSPPQAEAQQEVRGVVRESGSGMPVEGAMVVLLAGDDALVQVLTAANGSFRLAVPKPGRYRLRVDRIGYASTYLAAFDIAAGSTVDRSIETGVQPIELSALDVEGARRCEVRPAEGIATARVWEEARKALAAAAWTADRGLYRFAWTRFVRELSTSGRRILSEERTNRNRLTDRPFVSVDIDVLAREGFIQTVDGEDVYAAPDAAVLLSDAFLDTHCLGLDRREDDGVHLIGLRFRPIRGRNVPEIEGVLWLEENGARLRSVEYVYVNLGQRLASGEAGGELHFRALPNGTWIVHEWHIRLPRLREERNASGETVRTTLLGYTDEGAVVRQIARASGEVLDRTASAGAIRGVVVDSLGQPAAGISVRIQGTVLSMVTGPDGGFTFTDLATGTWSVGASHPLLEAVGYDGVFHPVDVAGAEVPGVRLRLPSVRQVVLERCRTPHLALDSAALIGIVVDAAGARIAGAGVRAFWTDYRVTPRGATARVSQREHGIGIDTDARGVFALCGIPTQQTVRTSVSYAERTSDVWEVRVDDAGDALWVELVLPAAPAAAPAPGRTVPPDPESRWLAAHGFELRRETALLQRDRREISALAADSLAQILRLAPHVEVRPLANGRTEFLLNRAPTTANPAEPEPCVLDFYLNGSLVQQRLGDISALHVDRFLDPHALSGIEVFDAATAPVGRLDDCGAILLWSFRLADSRDPVFTGSVSGRVTRLPGSQPLAGIRVTLEPGALVRVTDDAGRFDFGSLPPARYRVAATGPDLGIWSTLVRLRAGSTANITIELEPRAAGLPARTRR